LNHEDYYEEEAEVYEYLEELREKGIVEYVTSYEKFKNILRENKVVVAVFTTPTCSACFMYKPIFYIVAEKLQNKAKWIEVDAYAAPEAAIEAGVMATPTTAVIIDGEIANGLIGILDEETLEETLNEALKHTQQKPKP